MNYFSALPHDLLGVILFTFHPSELTNEFKIFLSACLPVLKRYCYHYLSEINWGILQIIFYLDGRKEWFPQLGFDWINHRGIKTITKELVGFFDKEETFNDFIINQMKYNHRLDKYFLCALCQNFAENPFFGFSLFDSNWSREGDIFKFYECGLYDYKGFETNFFKLTLPQINECIKRGYRFADKGKDTILSITESSDYDKEFIRHFNVYLELGGKKENLIQYDKFFNEILRIIRDYDEYVYDYVYDYRYDNDDNNDDQHNIFNRVSKFQNEHIEMFKFMIKNGLRFVDQNNKIVSFVEKYFSNQICTGNIELTKYLISVIPVAPTKLIGLTVGYQLSDEIVLEFLSRGVPPDYKFGHRKNGIFELKFPLIFNVSELMIRHLLDQGVPVNSRDGEGNTLFFHTLTQETRNLLLKKGLNINLVNNLGQNALIYKVKNGHGMNLDIKWLIDHGCNLNHQDNFANTALMYAVQNQNVKAVSLLINKKTNFQLKNLDGKNVIELIRDIKRSSKLQEDKRPTQSYSYYDIYSRYSTPPDSPIRSPRYSLEACESMLSKSHTINIIKSILKTAIKMQN